MTELHSTMATGWNRAEAAGRGDAPATLGGRCLAGLRWLSRGPGRLLETVETWRERDRLRRQLAALPEHTLKDIGLTAARRFTRRRSRSGSRSTATGWRIGATRTPRSRSPGPWCHNHQE